MSRKETLSKDLSEKIANELVESTFRAQDLFSAVMGHPNAQSTHLTIDIIHATAAAMGLLMGLVLKARKDDAEASLEELLSRILGATHTTMREAALKSVQVLDSMQTPD